MTDISEPASGVKADLETLVSLAKRRGFVFPSAEIYGGFAAAYDYGPLGAQMRRNIAFRENKPATLSARVPTSPTLHASFPQEPRRYRSVCGRVAPEDGVWWE